MSGNADSMRVLIAAPFGRGLDHGGSQRATAMAERLEERGMTIDWRVVEAGPVTVAVRLRSLLALSPAGVDRYPLHDHGGAAPDLAVASHSYLTPQLASLPDRVTKVIDFHNLEWRHLSDSALYSKGLQRAYLRAQSALMRRFERRTVASSDLSLFTSEEELRWARSVAPDAELMLLPSVLPSAAEQAARALDERMRGSREPKLVYVGTVRFPPHLGALTGFLREAWPEIRQAVPGIRLTIAGDCSEEDRRALSAHPGVEALGFVEDVRPLLERSAAVVMPISGRAGTSMRALYCALAGVWVIGTPAAFRGLAWQMGTTVENPPEWARAVREAIESGPQHRERIVAAREAALTLQRDPGPWDDLDRRIRHLNGRS